jgi:hypothetical protein
MTPRRRPPFRVLAPGIAGFVLVTIAVVVETAMGSGNGHRYVPIDVVQGVGSALTVLSAVLALIEVGKNRGSR